MNQQGKIEQNEIGRSCCKNLKIMKALLTIHFKKRNVDGLENKFSTNINEI